MTNTTKPTCPRCKDTGITEGERYIAYITSGADVPYYAYCDDCEAGAEAEEKGVLDDPMFRLET